MDAFRQKIADQIERQKEIKKEQIGKYHPPNTPNL
jgi:hypothetical protein